MYELFHVGQLLRCKVTDSNRAGKTGKWKPKLTIQPNNINQNLTSDMLKTGLVNGNPKKNNFRTLFSSLSVNIVISTLFSSMNV